MYKYVEVYCIYLKKGVFFVNFHAHFKRMFPKARALDLDTVFIAQFKIKFFKGRTSTFTLRNITKTIKSSFIGIFFSLYKGKTGLTLCY